MESFNDYVNNGSYDNVFKTVNDIAKNFDGKSTDELLSAIYKEALKGKRNGTLKNSDVDNFVATISPFLEGKKLKLLKKVAEEIKKIN